MGSSTALYSIMNNTLECFSLEFHVYSCIQKIFPPYIQNKQPHHYLLFYFCCSTLGMSMYLESQNISKLLWVLKILVNISKSVLTRNSSGKTKLELVFYFLSLEHPRKAFLIITKVYWTKTFNIKTY